MSEYRWAWGWNPPLVAEPGRSIWAPPRYRLLCVKRWPIEALSLEEIILYLRLDPETINGPEKPLLAAMLASAVRALEDHAQVAVMQQDWRMTVRHWPAVWTDGLELPLPPFRELLRIRVNDRVQPLDQYFVDRDELRASRLYPAAGYWPTVWTMARRPDAIEIIFRAGAEKPEELSPVLRQALLMAIATWYENRESLQQFTHSPMIEIGWRPLLETYRPAGFA